MKHSVLKRGSHSPRLFDILTHMSTVVRFWWNVRTPCSSWKMLTRLVSWFIFARPTPFALSRLWRLYLERLERYCQPSTQSSNDLYSFSTSPTVYGRQVMPHSITCAWRLHLHYYDCKMHALCHFREFIRCTNISHNGFVSRQLQYHLWSQSTERNKKKKRFLLYQLLIRYDYYDVFSLIHRWCVKHAFSSPFEFVKAVVWVTSQHVRFFSLYLILRRLYYGPRLPMKF